VHRPAAALSRPAAAFPSWALPCVLLLVLSLPGISLPYLWDDYYFLGNALAFRSYDLLPDWGDHFYRPVSRGIYFAFLNLLGANGALVGHIVNLTLLLVAVGLLYHLVEKLATRRIALLSGLLFGSVGAVPFLSSWVSGCQDLFAIVFVLLALNLQVTDRAVSALAATALGLLSKETVVATIPVLALTNWILGRKTGRNARTVISYGALVACWSLIHPGIHKLLGRGLQSGATGYVGLENATRWPVNLGKYLLTMSNVPMGGFLPWRVSYLVAGALGVLVLVVADAKRTTRDGAERSTWAYRQSRVAILFGALAAAPLLLTSLMLHGWWAPYYAALPSVGGSVLLAFALEKLPARAIVPTATAFLLLGICCRTGRIPEGVPAEQNFQVTGPSLRIVEQNFKKIQPALPKGALALVSIQKAGLAGIYTHLYYFQAMRIWYRDPDLRTYRPDWRPGDAAGEFLFWVSPNLDVGEIDLTTMSPRSTGDYLDHAEYEKALRYYARGLSASGHPIEGVRLLLAMPERDHASWALDRRLAAMLLFQNGRAELADSILGHVPRVRHDNAIDIVTVLLEDATPGAGQEDSAVRAFSLSSQDPEVWREMMHRFEGMNRWPEAARLAVHLLAVSPGDSGAQRVLALSERSPRTQPAEVPGPPTHY